MKLINADTIVHWQSYDDEHETFPEHEGTIAEFLDAMTDEGCPESVDTLPSALQEAIRRIEKKLDEVYGYPKTEYAEGYANACKVVIKMLKNLSPMDAVPLVHGKWIDEGFYADGHGAHAFRCSECGGHIIEYDVDPFCRWCGADMRKGDDDGKAD